MDFCHIGHLEYRLLEALASGRAQDLKRCFDELQQVVNLACGSTKTLKLLDREQQASIHQVMRRITLVAQCFAQCEQNILLIENDTLTAAASILDAHSRREPHHCLLPVEALKKAATATDRQDTCPINAHDMREWMYYHISHPFPTNEDKEMITKESNSGALGTKGALSIGQCTLWFINARRRSGWTAWSRRFGEGNRNRIRAIVAAIQGRSLPATSEMDRPDEIETRLEELVVAKEDLDRHLNKHELAELCRREFQKVIDWIQQGPGQKVGDWMDDIAAEAKTISSRKRKCVDDDKDHGQARKVVRDTRSARRQVAEDKGRSSTANIEEVEDTQPFTPPRRTVTPRRDFSGPSTCSYSSFSSFVSGNTMANSSTTSLTSFDEGPTHPSCPITALDESPPLVNTGSSGESSPSGSYESPPALTPDAEAFVRRYLEEQRAQNAESMATSESHTARSHSPPPPERLIRKLPARGVAQAQYSEGNVFRPPITAQAATGANWGLPATPASIRSTNTSRQASLSSDTPDYGGWLPFVGED